MYTSSVKICITKVHCITSKCVYPKCPWRGSLLWHRGLSCRWDHYIPYWTGTSSPRYLVFLIQTPTDMPGKAAGDGTRACFPRRHLGVSVYWCWPGPTPAVAAIWWVTSGQKHTAPVCLVAFWINKLKSFLKNLFPMNETLKFLFPSIINGEESQFANNAKSFLEEEIFWEFELGRGFPEGICSSTHENH